MWRNHSLLGNETSLAVKVQSEKESHFRYFKQRGLNTGERLYGYWKFQGEKGDDGVRARLETLGGGYNP